MRYNNLEFSNIWNTIVKESIPYEIIFRGDCTIFKTKNGLIRLTFNGKYYSLAINLPENEIGICPGNECFNNFINVVVNEDEIEILKELENCFSNDIKLQRFYSKNKKQIMLSTVNSLYQSIDGFAAIDSFDDLDIKSSNIDEYLNEESVSNLFITSNNSNELKTFILTLFKDLKINLDEEKLNIKLISANSDPYLEFSILDHASFIQGILYEGKFINLQYIEKKFGLEFGNIYRGENGSCYEEYYGELDDINIYDTIYQKDRGTLQNNAIVKNNWISC